MKYNLAFFLALAAVLVLSACRNADKGNKASSSKAAVPGNYAEVKQFLAAHSGELVELQSPDSNARVLLSPRYQGRVMTSTAAGDSGSSFGWINFPLIASGEIRKQFNPVGGEERFWMGPEGGQYSIFFKAGDSFDIAHWQVPAFIDTDSFALVQKDSRQARFSHDASIVNYSGIGFRLHIDRTIRILDTAEIARQLGVPLPDSLQMVGYESINRITNTGSSDWTEKNGLLSVWLLGQFTPSPETFVILPFYPVAHARSYMTDNYFGTIPPGRLRVRDSIIIFTCDGHYRSKIGLAPRVAKPVAGSFDFSNNTLTLLVTSIDSTKPYVNSKWEWQQEPFKGDAVNSYNDGPLADGSQLGPFYEIETSSPALRIRHQGHEEYRQVTCHFQGSYPALRQLASRVLGVDLDSIRK